MTEAPAHQVAAEARAVAAAVAGSGGIRVREIAEPGEHREVEALFTRIWETGPAPSLMSGELMRMLSYTGAYVAGAFAGTQLLGASVGFITDGLPGADATHLHSHITGVAAESRGRHVGLALKLHQRAWALDRGFDRITWTFDPLVRRNAYFNLTKLAARATRYLVDFYGDMRDSLNEGQGSDRLLVDWPLEHKRVIAAARGDYQTPDYGEVRTLLRCGAGQVPVTGHEAGSGAFACQVPADIEALRRTNPEVGRLWRAAIRAVLHSSLASGAQIVGFDRNRGYLLTDARWDPW